MVSRQPERFIEPGQLMVSVSPITITTVLGSCIAVCLHDPRIGAGGANHYVLPRPQSPQEESCRYGALAIPVLLGRLIAAGAELSRLRAAVVGGSRPSGVNSPVFVGGANRDLAIKMLADRGIAVVCEDTGGSAGRKLRFDTGTGAIEISSIVVAAGAAHGGI